MKKILKYVGVVTLMMVGVLCTGCTKDNEGRKEAKVTDIFTFKPYQISELIALSRCYYEQRNGYLPPEVEWQENEDGTFLIKLYELVKDDGGIGHTATSAIYTVDVYGKGKEEIMLEDVEFPEVSVADIVYYMEEPIELKYIANTEAHKEWNIKDQTVLEECFKALETINIKEKSDVRTADAEEILIFKLADGTEWTLTFENGNFRRNSTVYITEGYAKVRKVLKEYLKEEGLWN